jgi:MFS family permease
MNSFEDIQKDWLSQPLNEVVKPAETKLTQDKWQKRQRKVLRSNLFITIAFLIVVILSGCLYFQFRHMYRWPFDVSIVAMCSLAIIFLIVSWKSYGFKKENLEVSSVDFIDYQINKLQWQRKILKTYVWVYWVLLWIVLGFYTVEVTSHGSLLFTLTALGVITAYFIGVSLISWFLKNKKQIRKIDEIIDELKQLQESLK